MYILRGTSKLNYQNNRYKVVKRLHTLWTIFLSQFLTSVVTFWTYLSLINDVNLPSKSIKAKNSKNCLLLASWRIRIRIRTNKDGSGSGRSKNIRIRIHNTVLDLLQKFLPCVQLHSMEYPGSHAISGNGWKMSPPPIQKVRQADIFLAAWSIRRYFPPLVNRGSNIINSLGFLSWDEFMEMRIKFYAVNIYLPRYIFN
jgi:hypothetical protein